MRSSSLSKCALFAAAAIIFLLAGGVWAVRKQRAYRMALQMQRERSQHAAALLFQAFQAVNYLTYSAYSKTMAQLSDRKMDTVAFMVRTPQSLSIKYISGDQRGLESGFNQRWFWRK